MVGLQRPRGSRGRPTGSKGGPGVGPEGVGVGCSIGSTVTFHGSSDDLKGC